MKLEKLLDVIQQPHISEKSTRVNEKHKQYVFKISPWATKSNVSMAIKKIFGAETSSVQIVNIKGKQKKRGNIIGRRKSTKKAYVTLSSETELNLTKLN
jgi:large subunit ribosomal protein L23